MDVLPSPSKQLFQNIYPETAGHLLHQLGDHPLLTLDAMVSLASRMKAHTLEHNGAVDVPLGTPTTKLPHNGLTTVQTIEQIETARSWVLLREIEQDPAYAALMRDVLGEIEPLIAAVTGPMHKLRAYIFISSPQAVTQLHFDPEYNILFQAHGTKTMTLFPPADPEIIGQHFFERYYSGGQRYLPWQDAWAARGNPIRIAPGEAIYVPLFAPHWVKVHDAVSISLSLTWCSEYSIETADAHKFNHKLRGLGLKPGAPAPFPGRNRMKSLGHRALEKVPFLR
ncbi:cupin-like domain-containing protein [Sphingobium scionense]|uniref:JmjC domain-containing protein n=1 Tax=Sphingobium scionense TaxID=1404341 RepID=A0A7W6LPJ3_9SPHN|nr:cupin-like domain-containing protein [Sphingobium scionense]MBB4148149.1 hypothetical protein [Sphingobium scionense]